MPPHKWHFEITKPARSQISSLSKQDRRAVFSSIRELLLADNPKSLNDVKKLVDSDDLWRKKQGNYRILFTVEAGEVVHNKFTYKGTLQIVKVADRKDVYKK